MDETKEINWKSHPIVDDFPRSLLAAFLVFAFPVGFGFSFNHAGYGLIAFIIIFSSMLTYFFPCYYTINQETLTIRFIFKTQRLLKEFRNFYVNPMGVHFSTFSNPSPLDPFRGTYVKFGKHKKTVLPFIEETMARVMEEEESVEDDTVGKQD